jgi:hypothetical protein
VGWNWWNRRELGEEEKAGGSGCLQMEDVEGGHMHGVTIRLRNDGDRVLGRISHLLGGVDK